MWAVELRVVLCCHAWNNFYLQHPFSHCLPPQTIHENWANDLIAPSRKIAYHFMANVRHLAYICWQGSRNHLMICNANPSHPTHHWPFAMRFGQTFFLLQNPKEMLARFVIGKKMLRPSFRLSFWLTHGHTLIWCTPMIMAQFLMSSFDIWQMTKLKTLKSSGTWLGHISDTFCNPPSYQQGQQLEGQWVFTNNESILLILSHHLF